MFQCGGSSGEQAATTEIQNLANRFRSEVEDTHGSPVSVYQAVSYTTQITAGTNYTILINVGNGDNYSLTVHEPIGGQPQFSDCVRA